MLRLLLFSLFFAYSQAFSMTLDELNAMDEPYQNDMCFCDGSECTHMTFGGLSSESYGYVPNELGVTCDPYYNPNLRSVYCRYYYKNEGDPSNLYRWVTFTYYSEFESCTDPDECTPINPPNEYQGLYYSGERFSEKIDCENAVQSAGLSYGENAICIESGSLDPAALNACPEYMLYVDCKMPPSTYDRSDGTYVLFGPFGDKENCIESRSGFSKSSSCFQLSQYCPWYFYAQAGSECDDLQFFSYEGYPYAGTYGSLAQCNDALQKLGCGQGYCIPIPNCEPKYDGFFNIGCKPESDNNLSDDNDGDGRPDGPVPPDSTVSDQPDIPDQPDPGTVTATDDNNDGVDLTPILDAMRQMSDRNHIDLENIKNKIQGTNDRLDETNSKLDTSNNLLTQISSNTLKTQSKIEDLKSLMREQNQKTDLTNAALSDISGKIDQTNEKLDESNDHLQNIETNISGISGFFDSLGSLINDPGQIQQDIESSVTEIAEKYIGQQVIDMPDCGVVPTIAGDVFGQHVVFLSEDIINQWPLDIFRSMIYFFFVLSGIIIVFRGS